jgi:hypothetical protein
MPAYPHPSNTSIFNICHESMQLEPITTCCTCPNFAIHSHCRPEQSHDTWRCVWCERGQTYDLTRLHDVPWAPCLQLHDTIMMTLSGPTALANLNNGFTHATTPILPTHGPSQWTHPPITFNHEPINPDLDDVLPTGNSQYTPTPHYMTQPPSPPLTDKHIQPSHAPA